MGQKVHPIGFRLRPQLQNNWFSLFYADKKSYPALLLQSHKIRSHILKKYHSSLISRVLISFPSDSEIIVTIFPKKPGVIIGKSGADIELLKSKIESISDRKVFINVHEVKKPDLDAQIIATSIALQIEKRVSFKKAMKNSIQSAMKQGARGIKVSCSGRLGGAEIARTEGYKEGRVPLHTLRANVNYACAEALTTYGIIGVKVWTYVDFSHNKKNIIYK